MEIRRNLGEVRQKFFRPNKEKTLEHALRRDLKQYAENGEAEDMFFHDATPAALFDRAKLQANAGRIGDAIWAAHYARRSAPDKTHGISLLDAAAVAQEAHEQYAKWARSHQDRALATDRRDASKFAKEADHSEKAAKRYKELREALEDKSLQISPMKNETTEIPQVFQKGLGDLNIDL